MIPPSSLPSPSSFLPSIKAISATPTASLLVCIEKLRAIYSPPVRGTRRRQAASIDGQRDESRVSELRGDRFELSYVLNWLTALVCWYSEELNDGEEDTPLLREASAVLALCAGTASAGVFTRRFDFSSSQSCSDGEGEGGEGVSVTLRDVPLDNNDYGSVGAQTWGGACVLSEMIVEQPGRFGLQGWEGDRPLRVLELGTGTGLVSLVVAKILFKKGIRAKVVPTDYYPSVLENLATNIASNGFTGSSMADDSVSCTPLTLDWSKYPSMASSDVSETFREPFDVAFGADVVYEPQHAEWIRDCLERLLAKPTADKQSFFHLLIPLRHTHTAESESVEKVFPFVDGERGSEEGLGKGSSILRTHEKELITCDTESGEEVVYAYYKIGW